MSRFKAKLQTRGSVNSLYLIGDDISASTLQAMRNHDAIASRALVYLKSDKKTVRIQFAGDSVTDTDIASVVYAHHQATRNSKNESIVGKYDTSELRNRQELEQLVEAERALCGIG